MNQTTQKQEPEKKKGFFARLFERLDKKLEEKAKDSGCCSSNKPKGGSCC